MNDYPLVTIIIPVYKVEAYLDECVRSVMNQTYRNLEIILVDDGSPDRCGEMCDAYAREDSRIHVIHKTNGGVAKARNSGLEYVHGAFVFFLDSDDVLDVQCIEFLLHLANQYQADMVCAECCCIDENSKKISDSDNIASADTRLFNTQDALKFYASKEWAPWNRLIRAEVHAGILFPDYKIHEDEAIKFLLLERCRVVVHTCKETYLYRQRRNSITSAESGVDRIDMFYSRYQNLVYLKTYHIELIPLFLPKVCEDALLNLGILSHNKLTYSDVRVAQLVDFFKEDYQIIIQSPYVSKSQKLRCYMINHSNWNRKNNLYVCFYTILDKLRGK